MNFSDIESLSNINTPHFSHRSKSIAHAQMFCHEKTPDDIKSSTLSFPANEKDSIIPEMEGSVITCEDFPNPGCINFISKSVLNHVEMPDLYIESVKLTTPDIDKAYVEDLEKVADFDSTPYYSGIDTPLLCTPSSDKDISSSRSAHMDIRTSISSLQPQIFNSKEIETLADVKRKHMKNITLAYLNINSIRNKIDDLKSIVDGAVDILVIAETKIDQSFPTAQFLMENYNKPLRKDISSTSGGLLMYIKKGIAARPVKMKLGDDKFQFISITLHLKTSKWLLISLYRPEYVKIPEFMEQLNNIIIENSKLYSNVIIMGDFNMKETDPLLAEFKEVHSLYNLIKSPTCYKSRSNPSLIDHIFTNKKYSFIESHAIETGLSDHHKMIFTCMKSTYFKMPPKIISFRDYKYFNENTYLSEVADGLHNIPVLSYEAINRVAETLLEKHAPTKTKTVRGNDKAHMNKNLRKAIMHRSKLKNIADKTNEPLDIQRYKKQRNVCVYLNKKAKRESMKAVDAKKVEDAKSFWKIYKPLLSKTCVTDDKIILVENNEVINDDAKIAKVFNDFFTNITKSLHIYKWPSPSGLEVEPQNIVDIIEKYRTHPSILKIKENISCQAFSFQHVMPEDVLKAINKLRASKKSRGKIPVKTIKLLTKVNLYYLTDCINNNISEEKFPDDLKLADISAIFKADDPTSKECYRPISILEAYSKVYERLLATQINAFMKDKLSPKLCAYREGHSAPQLLLKLVDRWRKCLDKSGVVGTILMDLSKAFDSLPHDLLVAKLEAYGFSHAALKLMLNYLSNRFQRVKIGSTFSEWLKIIAGIPQGSVLGPILFNIFINDIFYVLPDIFNFADDNTIDACCDNIALVIDSLEKDLNVALKWFEYNSLIANPQKFQIMFLGLKDATCYCLSVPTRNNSNFKIFNEHSIQFGKMIIIKSVPLVKLLGLAIDNKLDFNKHIDNLCSKAKSSVNALQRIANFTDSDSLKHLIDTYFLSCFSYAPIVWMFCSKEKNNKINALHKRALKLLTPNETDYEKMLKINKTANIHTRNIQFLLIEVFRCIHKLNPMFLCDEVCINDKYHSSRNGMQLTLPKTKKMTLGMRTLSFRGSMLWNYLPKKFKTLSFVMYKNSIKSLSKTRCSCTLCRI